MAAALPILTLLRHDPRFMLHDPDGNFDSHDASTAMTLELSRCLDGLGLSGLLTLRLTTLDFFKEGVAPIWVVATGPTLHLRDHMTVMAVSLVMALMETIRSNAD